jgi:hypothetical protein
MRTVSAGSKYIFVGRWCVSVGPHGIEVAETADGLPSAPLVQRPGGKFLPEPFPDLLGRQDKTETILAALGEQKRAEVYGDCGIGKTSLLCHLAHRAAVVFPDLPVVYASAAGQTLEDLLQTLFNLLYQTNAPVKPAHDRLCHDLGRARAVLLLDDIQLGAEDLADLLAAVPNCQVIFTCHRQRRITEGRLIGLAGLDEQAATQLVTQALGRELRDDEHADFQRLWSLVAGHPLRLLQAAGLVRGAGQTFAGLVAALQAGDPIEVLQRACVEGLSTQQQRVIAVLAMACGMLLPVELAATMSAAGNLRAELRELRQRGVVEQRRDRYGLPVCSLGQPQKLISPGLDRSLALRALIAWLEHPDRKPQELLSVSGSVLTLLEFACQVGEWKTVIRLVRAIEPVLILSGRWDAWRHALEQGLQAARTVHHVADEAYFLHQIGSRELSLVCCPVVPLRNCVRCVLTQFPEQETRAVCQDVDGPRWPSS